MDIEPVGRRVHRTRRQLHECLITLLKEKKIQDITVRELTDTADLDRGVFCLHYKDVFDLLEKTGTEFQEGFNQSVHKHDAVGLKRHPSTILNEIYYLVYDNAGLTEIPLGENEDLSFVNRPKQFIHERCLKDQMEVFRSGSVAASDTFFSFVVPGYIGLVQCWFQTGLEETPEQMAELTEHIIAKGVGVLEIDPCV